MRKQNYILLVDGRCASQSMHTYYLCDCRWSRLKVSNEDAMGLFEIDHRSVCVQSGGGQTHLYNYNFQNIL